VTTVLDKELKRRIAVDGADYTVVLDPDGLKLVGKGKRTADVALRWADLLSGDAALAVALNASVGTLRKPREATPPPSAPKKAAKRATRRG
jgi:hypothetical protein